MEEWWTCPRCQLLNAPLSSLCVQCASPAPVIAAPLSHRRATAVVNPPSPRRGGGEASRFPPQQRAIEWPSSFPTTRIVVSHVDSEEKEDVKLSFASPPPPPQNRFSPFTKSPLSSSSSYDRLLPASRIMSNTAAITPTREVTFSSSDPFVRHSSPYGRTRQTPSSSGPRHSSLQMEGVPFVESFYVPNSNNKNNSNAAAAAATPRGAYFVHSNLGEATPTASSALRMENGGVHVVPAVATTERVIQPVTFSSSSQQQQRTGSPSPISMLRYHERSLGSPLRSPQGWAANVAGLGSSASSSPPSGWFLSVKQEDAHGSISAEAGGIFPAEVCDNTFVARHGEKVSEEEETASFLKPAADDVKRHKWSDLLLGGEVAELQKLYLLQKRHSHGDPPLDPDHSTVSPRPSAPGSVKSSHRDTTVGHYKAHEGSEIPALLLSRQVDDDASPSLDRLTEKVDLAMEAVRRRELEDALATSAEHGERRFRAFEEQLHYWQQRASSAEAARHDAETQAAHWHAECRRLQGLAQVYREQYVPLLVQEQLQLRLFTALEARDSLLQSVAQTSWKFTRILEKDLRSKQGIVESCKTATLSEFQRSRSEHK